MKKENEGNRTETLRFRASLNEVLALDEKAYELKLNRSNYLRRLVFEKEVILYDFSGLDELTAEIGKIGTNINQIAKKLNQGGKLDQDNAEFLTTSMETMHSSIQQIYKDVMKKKMEKGG